MCSFENLKQQVRVARRVGQSPAQGSLYDPGALVSSFCGSQNMSALVAVPSRLETTPELTFE